MPFHKVLLPLLILFFFIGASFFSRAQNSPSRNIDRCSYSEQLEELRNCYGQNKKGADAFELPCLIALSHYPELADVNIEFVYKKIATTMAARPRFNTLFRKKENREYRIFINTDSVRVKGVLLHQVPFNAQVGIISHELAHIMDYESKSVACLAKTGIQYLSKGFRSRMEKETDMMAIKRGFGWQLYSFTDFLFTCKDVPADYLKYKQKVYYSPADFLILLNGLDQYKECLPVLNKY